jgi:hypothetical protein
LKIKLKIRELITILCILGLNYSLCYSWMGLVQPAKFLDFNVLMAMTVKKTIIFRNVTPFNLAGKAVPLQAWSGPQGSRKLRFPVFMTTAQDGGKVVSLTHRPRLPPGNKPGTHFS